MCWGPWQAGIKGVIRLNGRAYDRRRFTNNGLAHYDLYFPDGRCLFSQALITILQLLPIPPFTHLKSSQLLALSYNLVDMCVSSLCKRTTCGCKVASNDIHSQQHHHSALSWISLCPASESPWIKDDPTTEFATSLRCYKFLVDVESKA